MVVLFQSASGPKAGGNTLDRCGIRWKLQHYDVSIRLRPEGRRNSSINRGKGMRFVTFQSASGPKAGGNRRRRRRCQHRQHVFNHFRPEGRRKPPSAPDCGCRWTRFNPPPARRPEETRMTQKIRLFRACFNPPPARRPEETLLQPIDPKSIQCFNPPPARRPEETASVENNERKPRCFNPPPARRPEETCADSNGAVTVDGSMKDIPGFNPPPARRPEETEA